MSGGEACPLEVISVKIFERISRWLAYRNELRLQESPTQVAIGVPGMEMCSWRRVGRVYTVTVCWGTEGECAPLCGQRTTTFLFGVTQI